jgi:hypothetical protein
LYNVDVRNAGNDHRYAHQLRQTPREGHPDRRRQRPNTLDGLQAMLADRYADIFKKFEED